MSSKTMNPAIPAGADGPVAIGHSPEVAQAYRDAASEPQRRQASGLPPASAEAAPSAGRVDAVLAGRARDKRIHALRADLMRYGKETQHPQIGMSGMQLPHMIERQQQVLMAVEATQAEIENLAALDGQELITWAEASGLIRWTPNGSAVL